MIETDKIAPKRKADQNDQCVQVFIHACEKENEEKKGEKTEKKKETHKHTQVKAVRANEWMIE